MLFDTTASQRPCGPRALPVDPARTRLASRIPCSLSCARLPALLQTRATLRHLVPVAGESRRCTAVRESVAPPPLPRRASPPSHTSLAPRAADTNLAPAPCRDSST